MILIVADTGPINYLIQIGHIELLARLVQKTVLPVCRRKHDRRGDGRGLCARKAWWILGSL